MKKFKLGFTLGEVLVSVAVIGVIMAIAVHSIKIVKASYTSLTFFAYNNLSALVGEIMAGDADAFDKSKNLLPKALSSCRIGNMGMVTTILAPDHRSYANPPCFYAGDPTNNNTSIAQDNLFCQHAIYFANTAGETRCGNNDLFDVSFDNDRFEPYITNVEKNWNSPNFITTNGQRFYISKWTSNANVSDTYGFRIVAIDLNGKSAPNQTGSETGKSLIPDIVQFLILDNGEIYPIGVAGSNVNVGQKNKENKVITYLNARVKGYNYRYDENRTSNVSPSCLVKRGDGSTEQICNFATVYLQTNSGQSFYSYKEALCGAFEGTGSLTYSNYCKVNYHTGSEITKSELCPPSNSEKRVDECNVKLVKPMFRYNFR